MKKILLTAAVTVLVGLTSFAADKKINQRVLAAFEKEFATATNVSWEVLKHEDIYHASFVYANEVMEAYYNTEGELIAAARHLSAERLPLLVNKSIRENFGKYQFKTATEYMSADATSYIITLENQKAIIVARIYTNGSAEVLKKTKKS
ncbi:MAG TPA: hypothetical protein VD993_14310 [Chitinophagaceae bacterium]|nr:hypothetical protein [Chitinophagaceae bacterium]